MLRAPAEYYQDLEDSSSSENESSERSHSNLNVINNNESTQDSTSQTVDGIETNLISLNNLLWRRSPIENNSLRSQQPKVLRDRKVVEAVPTEEIEVRNTLAHSMRSINENIESQYDNRPNPTIQSHARDAAIAESYGQPNKLLPKFLISLFPRLGRVPSPGEKLFWFGSHKFYIWCVEWVLFFSTINVSASIAQLAFVLKETGGKVEENENTVVRLEKGAVSVVDLLESLRASASNAQEKESSSLLLLVVALSVGVFSLLYVLLRVAGVMKKYIFVMNNAQLLPKIEVDVAIKDVSGNKREDSTTCRNCCKGTGAETAEEPENTNSNNTLRRKLTKYISRNGGGEFLTSPSSNAENSNGT